jgi:peptidoglycan hydrolase-like protein with peptidoglycan-binding domain
MSAQGERETAAANFDHPLLDLEQLRASVAASDARIARIREAIHALGYGSVAQALERPPAPDDTIASHDAPTEGAAGPLPWISIAAIITASTLFMLLGNPKPSASNNRPPDVRSISLAPVTTAMAPRENEQALTDGSGASAGIGLRQTEQSTVAPPQEAATEMAMQSTLPPTEEDRSPVAPLAVRSPPPIATPDPVITTFPRPLLDLGEIADAKRVQRRLTDLGFLIGTANGTWGPRSRQALRDFRGAQGLGQIDTWDEKAQQALFSPTAARALAAPATGTFVGGWGISADQCRQAPDNRSPLRINTRRAEASNTTCEFNSTQRESANEWRIKASCADEHDQWSANIRLTLAGSRLTWASERGTATYLRCPAT